MRTPVLRLSDSAVAAKRQSLDQAKKDHCVQWHCNHLLLRSVKQPESHNTCASDMLYLQDVVETHLLRDIAARSENFFQAASVVQDLRGVLARTYTQVKALRQEVSTFRLISALLLFNTFCTRSWSRLEFYIAYA